MKLSVKDIRVGNYVFNSITGKQERVGEIDISDPAFQMEFIDLTWDHLRRFGFIESGEPGDKCWTLNNFVVNYCHGICDSQLMYLNRQYKPTKILGVHHLQNLYYDLTNEELEIKYLL